MSLSSNTLIHFTSSKDALKGILAENFRISFCKEGPVLGDKAKEFFVPMVSFCDIPLSEVKDHIAKYGCYGLGMTRSWAARHGLNPVLYLEPRSKVANSYEIAAKYLATAVGDSVRNGQGSEQQVEATVALANILAFVKNYEGVLIRKGTATPTYRFSDEREWRYVPTEENFSLIGLGAFESETTRPARERADQLRLEFEPNDIKYIIIKDDSEIHEFIRHLQDVKGKYAHRDVERLTTRILTTEQILQDF